MITIAINGCGRIGRLLLRVFAENPEYFRFIKIGAINVGPDDPALLSYALTHDSIFGKIPENIQYKDNTLYFFDQSIKIYAEIDPKKLPWGTLNIDWVVDVSGKYTHREQAELHCKQGAQYVLISAPGSDEDITIIPGVNEQLFDKNKHHIISLGSCTTNAVAPLLKIIGEYSPIEYVSLLTIHALTSTQKLLDMIPHKNDVRKSRSALQNMIPAGTGAMETLYKIFPHLQGKMSGTAVRVPIPVVSLVEIAITSNKIVQKDEIETLLLTAAKSPPLAGILSITREELVSSDFIGNSSSVIVDMKMLECYGNNIRIFGWYDNEYGYCCRLRDFLILVSK